MTEFEFSIRATLRRSWHIFKENIWFFILLSFVMFVLSGFSNKHDGVLLKVLSSIASILWSYISVSVILAAIDGKQELLHARALRQHLPNFRQFLRLVGVAILSMLIIGVGFIALIIPGVYFMVRLAFSNFALVDRKEGVVASMRFSWRMVKGDIFWTVLLASVVALGVMILGFLAAVVGILLAYPIAMIFLGLLYRSLAAHHKAQSAVIEQPKEIPPASFESAPDPSVSGIQK